VGEDPCLRSAVRRLVLTRHPVEQARWLRWVLQVLLVASTIATGLMAGFFYAYACSVMVGLGRTDDPTFITSMQWINATVRNAAFAPAFFGALLLPVLASVVALWQRAGGARWVVAAASCYATAFLITLVLNVPLNEQLALAGPVERLADPSGVRVAFEAPWVRWNLLRTVASTAALAALAVALLRVKGDQPADPIDSGVVG
jgi:uncharacterized membrane protein